MPNFKQRRRKPSGPNKNERKVIRAQEAQRTETLGQRYPSVEKLTIHLEFISPQQHSLLSESRTFTPDNELNLKAHCPGRCGEGEFDLEGKVNRVVSNRETFAKTSARCEQPLYTSTDVCGCTFSVRLDAVYAPAAPL